MKVTRRQLRRLISEATQEIKVRTVSDDQYKQDISSLPPSMQGIATGQRSFENPNTRHVIGNFFMTKGVPYKPPKGYGSLKKLYNFYMILPDETAVSIDYPGFQITTSADAIRYLNLLNQNVTVLPMDNLANAESMADQVKSVIQRFNQEPV
tara:strand:+ start:39 stop:494 length:456 start_codon:yes stop_codon:yes gene_type:complete